LDEVFRKMIKKNSFNLINQINQHSMNILPKKLVAIDVEDLSIHPIDIFKVFS
jgi:hypothetical protein